MGLPGFGDGKDTVFREDIEMERSTSPDKPDLLRGEMFGKSGF
jgi:hypothetical protein